MLQCGTCQAVTPHRPTPPDGWLRCRRCVADTGPVVSAAPPDKRRGYVSLRIGTLVSIAVLIVVAGFTHVVHGGSVGLTVCEKDGWSLSDTFVDLDDFIGKPLISQLDKAKVLRAMFACGVLKRPAGLGEQ